MTFAHCNDCDWSQDDFWDANHHPFKSLYEQHGLDLLNKPLDEKVTGYDDNFLSERGYPTWREFLVQGIDSMAFTVDNMKWRNADEYEKSDKKCPKCGGWTTVD